MNDKRPNRGLIGGFRIWDQAKCGYIKPAVDVARNVFAAASVALKIAWVALWSGFRIWGYYDVVYRDSSGAIAWIDKAPNAVVNAALNYVLNIALGGGTQITSWYIGLVSNAGTPTFAAGDTHVTHAWTEFTDYSESTRQAWTPVTSTAQSITNTTAAVFSITGPGTLKGLFMSNVNTKASVAGGSSLLFSEGAFSAGNQTVSNGGTVEATYTCNAAST